MLVDKMPTEMILISSEVMNKHADNRNEVYWRNYDYVNNYGYWKLFYMIAIYLW
jgi:hypothetical protein